MQLTKHFTLDEFEYSSTAIRHGIDNTIPENLIPSVRNLCEHVLEPLRQSVRQPVIISSGYRCPALNRLVGGVKNSQHMKGEAADIYIADKRKLLRWFNYLSHTDIFDQLILERNGNNWWIHVSCRPDITHNRHQTLNILQTSNIRVRP